MNLIPKIAEMLNVEIGEEFKIAGHGDKYRFIKTEFQYYDKDYNVWCCASALTFNELLTGNAEIKKFPFEPKIGDTYHTVRLYWNELVVVEREFRLELTPLADKYCGNFFKTHSEAEKHKFEIYEKLTGKKWEQ